MVGRRKLVMIRTVAGFNFADECWTELQRTRCLVKGCARFVYDERTAYREMQRCRNCPCVWKCGLIVLSLYLCSSRFTYWLWFCYQVDSVRNQCNKNIQKLMEEMHFLELVSKWCQIKGGRVVTFPGKLLSANSSNQNFIGRLSLVP